MFKDTRRNFVKWLSVTSTAIGCKITGNTPLDSGLSTVSDGQEFDYVIVGSGAGGGPLAVNLAKAGFKVLVLEAGSDHGNREVYKIPAFHPQSSEDEGMSWDFYVKHYADSNIQRNDPKYTATKDGVLYPRAGTLGGCTAHNAMITVYPLAKDWDEMGRLAGDSSINGTTMRQYFQFVENATYQNQPLRKRGWLPVRHAPATLIIKDKSLIAMVYAGAHSIQSGALRTVKTFKALISLLVASDANSLNPGRDQSESVFQVPIAVTNNGHRFSVRDHLKSHQSARLTVWTNCLATRVLFDETQGESAIARGVEFINKANAYKAGKVVDASAAHSPRLKVMARKEVILAGGTFNTPQLLMLSGIGPKDQLQELARRENNTAFRLIKDLPGVGANLQDRYEVSVTVQTDRNMPTVEECKFESHMIDPCYQKWKEGAGPYVSNGGIVGMLKKSMPVLQNPDLFIFLLPSKFLGYRPGYSRDISRFKNVLSWVILKSHTHNTAGTVKLRSLNPTETPDINFHYFLEGTDPSGKPYSGDARVQDCESLVNAVKHVRNIVADAEKYHDLIDLDSGDVIEKYSNVEQTNFNEIYPGKHIANYQQLSDWVMKNAWGHHACGTCKMGTRQDPMAVVDSKFKVHGTQNLRIVDASVFPKIPGYFIVSSVYAISEKASDDILQDAGKRRRVAIKRG